MTNYVNKQQDKKYIKKIPVEPINILTRIDMNNFHVSKILDRLHNEIARSIKEHDDITAYHSGLSNGYYNGLVKASEMLMEILKEEYERLIWQPKNKQ